MRKKCLLIGGCGFLLSNFVRKQLYSGDNSYSFVTLDKLILDHSMKNYYANKHHQFHIGDVCDFNLLKSIIEFEKPDVVIFAAGDGTINSITTKLTGLQNLSKLQNRFEKLIYISSSEVGFNLSPESLEKSFEFSSEFFIKENFKNAIILRVPEIFGQRQNKNKIIPKIIESILDTKNINNSFTQKLYNFIFIDDFCSVLLSVIEGGIFNKVYNYYFSTHYSENMINIKLNVLNKSNNFDDKEYKDYLLLQDANWFNSKTALLQMFSFSDLKENCNIEYEQMFSFSEGLELTYNWYKNNKWWFKATSEK